MPVPDPLRPRPGPVRASRALSAGLGAKARALSTRLAARPALRALGPLVALLGAWALLDGALNLHHPHSHREPALWYLLPSLDLTVVLGLFALFGALGRRAPRPVLGTIAALVVFIRLFRVADGLVQQNYYRQLNLYVDLPLLPELVRLMRSTLPLPAFVLGAVLALLGLALAGLVSYGALALAHRALTTALRARILLGAVVALTAALSPLWPAASFTKLHTGFFGASVVPALSEQVQFALAADRLRRDKAAAIRAMQERLRQIPAGLERLGHADVFIFLVESYGRTLFARPRQFAGMRDTYDAFARELGQAGFHVASSLLDSPTYGGGSWFAHATLATGLRIGDGLEFGLLRQTRPQPRTMAWFFQQAGYRTVLVQPGTTRPFPEGEVYGFDRKYYAPDLQYQGPPFGWATMPDQYVVDFVHRQEVAPATRPLFIEYALVSSHAPWNVQPPIVDDWSRLAHGRVYHDLTPVRFPVTWQTLAEAGDAYVSSLVYDFEILKRYLTTSISRDALIIVMGDHQPSAKVTEDDPSPAVPIHVITRSRALIDLFTSAGYTAGLTPSPTGPIPGMETFLPDLLERLSTPR